MQHCPCGSEQTFANCCEKYISGKESAPTAEILMRSRYSAYVTGNIDYIVATHHERDRDALEVNEIKTWSENSKWLGLKIVSTEKGGEKDTEGKVEFIANFDIAGSKQAHHEMSEFKKVDGKWYFVDGHQVHQSYTRNSPKLGRNDPCSCGSGKKFKKCCGA
ncbi:hypothetical protein M899_2377 [Bacteriovorax sp. BSW11_IV]|uniref:YchJ family protein n=1 Tax=Bacteriovorax sp. BSW11_IV TaxID=1353529 RepID=UPI00038A171F|nr:YchJ family protein [Bacteriovorax sp. BSW11_IV]EQC44601.1 hypothetical protein M899_2377 [Bacteriovorax sp. BSW11_IV]